ncbi:polysaccharide deacetylase [Megasphaera cerevisiae DSM 20462]|uniref:Polysaccharide deacetylase n=1 Tax=Megasphaera cerevisiae DSM 20462 TaxID=1122219 RepID=A0A0J6X0A0_9FIRM|nr:polysaccharide deacetylase family protein [Megasphaera cerevisiae]KMO87567.1 polysaccharide deacetylase [Megasphaera cerevisiae DSM 20462]SJZ54066.1 Peptidoglycan/xylan/chitin deacetylase, PgdA/CDA1 family [Megasphaera cerevisiae DSM 20462]
MKKRHTIPFLIFLIFLIFSFSTIGKSADLESDISSVKKMNSLPTTYQGVIFTFGGLGRSDSVNDVLIRMRQQNMRGTFFVTEKELRNNADTIRNIIAYGQEIGIGVRPNETDGAAVIAAQIERIRGALHGKYGIDTRLVRQMYGPDTAAVREAVASTGCLLIGQTVNVVLSKNKEAQTVAEVMPVVFNKWATSMGRGQIAYFRMDFYTNPTLVGDMMMAVKEQKIDNIAYRTFTDTPETNPANDSAYQICSVEDALHQTKYLYTYPCDVSTIPKDLQPGYVATPINDKNFAKEFLARYIGSPEVGTDDRMYGFDRDIMRKADKTGVVKNAADNTIFLTFDDWGNDTSINKLLYVLRKHHVSGTFFIITRSMPNNPNLLRSIAAAGNEIGSHTNLHRPMAIREKNGKIRDLQSPEDYTTDVTTAYERLANVVGDVTVDGRHMLTRYFRPPTLAINKVGSRIILNAGYTYIVSGYESTEDYRAQSVSYLVGAIKAGIYDDKRHVRKGSIIIMHMSDTAKFTPQALDLVLTENEQRPDTDPEKFKVGRLNDYLKEGYTQMMSLQRRQV